MKKRTIILIFFAIVVALLAALVWWQFGNIKMAYYSFKYDNTQIEDLIQEYNRNVDDYLEAHEEYNVRPPTEVEQQLHREELITEGEFVDILTGKTDVKQIFGFDVQLDENKAFTSEEAASISKEELSRMKTDTTQPPEPAEPEESGAASAPPEAPASASPSASSNEEASQYIAKMYVLKSSFESQLDGLYNEAIDYYAQMSPDQRANAKAEMLKRFYSRATGLESQCDAQVEVVLANLTASLEASGGDKSVVEKIRQAYNEEKSLKKSYYLNLVK